MSMSRALDRNDTALLVVDVQDTFLKVIHEAERVVTNTVKLIEAAKVFDILIVVTLQNAARMGDVTQAVADALPQIDRFDKMTFSCFGGEGFEETLRDLWRKQVLICGIETHVCVNQTAHDCLGRDYRVHIAKDAISSRSADNWVTGIEKMRDSGCVITSTEMAIFELLRNAASPEFKKILPIVK